jgi:hypothetical protein
MALGFVGQTIERAGGHQQHVITPADVGRGAQVVDNASIPLRGSAGDGVLLAWTFTGALGA